MSPKLIIPALLLWVLLLAQGAVAASAQPKPAPARPPTQTARPPAGPDPGKQAACEKAWDQLSIKKGSRRRFIDACVKHG
jgi:hypothetical protein